MAFTTGWVRLTLRTCPGVPADAPADRLEVDGADHVLRFSPGRAGGATAGLLSGTTTPAAGAAQVFSLPPGSRGAREVVLSPWPTSSPPRLTGLRLTASPP